MLGRKSDSEDLITAWTSMRMYWMRTTTHAHKFFSIIADRQGQLLKTACGSPCYAAPEMIAGATGRANGDPANLPSIVVRSNHCPRKSALWCQPICQTADIVDSWNISHNVLLYALQSVCNISFIFIFVECCSGHSYAHVSDLCVWRCRCMMYACFYSSEFFRFFVFFNFLMEFLFCFDHFDLDLNLRCLTFATSGVVELFFSLLFVDTYPLRTWVL